MKKGFVAFLLFSVFAFSTSSPADEVKRARSNDVVDKYVLKDNGRLLRKLPGKNGRELSCDITTGVQDFKISQHPGDSATAYFIKDGDLHYVKNAHAGVEKGQCPPARTSLDDRNILGMKMPLMSNVRRQGGKYLYGVIPSTQSGYVNWAVDGMGVFKAWKNSGFPLVVSDIDDVSTVECFGEKGKAFSRKILLLQARNGVILTMEEDGLIRNQQVRMSIQEFRFARDVCQPEGEPAGASSGTRGKRHPRASGAR